MCTRKMIVGDAEVAHLISMQRYSYMKSLFLTLTLLLAAFPASAQDSTSVPWARHTFQSATLKEERQIFVALPDDYAASQRQYPVLVLLDANDTPQFLAAIANARFLASRGAIPGLIIAGIPNGKDRTRDLTPTPTGRTAGNNPTAGGADAFASFIADEVLPLVRAKYRTRPTAIFAGHSFGGLVALHIAATRPGAYTGIVAMSPSLWWNDSTLVTQYADAIAKTRGPLRLFATSGGLETANDVTTKRFAARLDSAASKSVAFAYRHYPDDSHGLTPAPSLMDGLRFVFAPLSIARLPISRLGPASDSASVVKAVLESEAAYAAGARLFGEPETLPENTLNNLGYGVLQALKMPGLAVWIFRRNAALHPESANVYDSLGDGLLAKGDTAAAIAELRRAVEIGTRTKHPVAAESQNKLRQLDKAAAQAGKVKP
jgi:predicted alpha/beta superfamily hydrolase